MEKWKIRQLQMHLMFLKLVILTPLIKILKYEVVVQKCLSARLFGPQISNFEPGFRTLKYLLCIWTGGQVLVHPKAG